MINNNYLNPLTDTRKKTAPPTDSIFNIPLFTFSQTLYLQIPASSHSLVSWCCHIWKWKIGFPFCLCSLASSCTCIITDTWQWNWLLQLIKKKAVNMTFVCKNCLFVWQVKSPTSNICSVTLTHTSVTLS